MTSTEIKASVNGKAHESREIMPAPMQRPRTVVRDGGLWYACLYGTRKIVKRVLDFLERRLVRIEQRRALVEPWTVSARRFTANENKQVWNEHDWSTRGEEWTRSSEWKDEVVRQFLVPHVPEGGTVLEIGPGGGRWTELLQRRARRLIVVDVAERAIQLCKERFAACSNIEYLVGDGRTIAVPDESVDVVWSFDVFVHVNPLDARNYFREFRRILKPGGRAMIHHAGPPLVVQAVRAGWRSDLTDKMVRDFIAENDMRLVDQFQSELVNRDDFLTVFEKPA